MGRWTNPPQQPIKTHKKVAFGLILWISICAFLAIFGRIFSFCFILSAGAVIFLCLRKKIRRQHALASAIVGVTAGTGIATIFSSASLLLLVFFGTASIPYMLTGSISSSHPFMDTDLGTHGSILMAAASASIFSLVALGLTFSSFKPGKNNTSRLGAFRGRKFTGILLTSFFGAVVSILATLFFLGFNGSALIAKMELIRQITDTTGQISIWPSLLIFGSALVLCTIVNATIWLYALPIRAIFTGRLIWRLYKR